MEEKGPGIISTDDVGSRTISTTTLLDARLIMAYAAGISDVNPAYFDDTKESGPMVHPGICFSLQWKSRFQIDRIPNSRSLPYLVHASTDLRIHQPFRHGEAITTQGRIISRRQIPPGVYSVERYHMTNGAGDLVAELDYSCIIRNGRLGGADIELECEIPRPIIKEENAEPIWESEVYIPLYAGQQYTECAGIYNPIHTERSVARAVGLPDTILHGSAIQAIALSVIINRCFNGDAQKITRVCGQIRSMVLMNTTIRIELLKEHDDAGKRTILFRMFNQDGQVVIPDGLVIGRYGLQPGR